MSPYAKMRPEYNKKDGWKPDWYCRHPQNTSCFFFPHNIEMPYHKGLMLLLFKNWPASVVLMRLPSVFIGGENASHIWTVTGFVSAPFVSLGTSGTKCSRLRAIGFLDGKYQRSHWLSLAKIWHHLARVRKRQKDADKRDLWKTKKANYCLTYLDGR